MPVLHVPVVRRARHLVLSSGGTRGVSYVGFLEALRDLCGVDYGVDTVSQPTAAVAPGSVRWLQGVAGTSVGAFFAFLLALAFSVSEVRALVERLTLADFADPNPFLLLTGVHAADDGTRLRTTLSACLLDKLGVRDATLHELRRRTGVDLVVVAADVTTGAVRYLRADTEPSMSAVQAVYASMALAPLFAAAAHNGHRLEDGGGLDPLPVGVWGADVAAGGGVLSAVLHWAGESGGTLCDAGGGTTGNASPVTGTATGTASPPTGTGTGTATAVTAGADSTSSRGYAGHVPAPVPETSHGKQRGAAAVSASVLSSSATATPSSTAAKGTLARLGRALYCALYASMVVQWCLMPAGARAACVVLDASDVGTVEFDLTLALKERLRAKGYQDTAAALHLMAEGKPPHRGASRFARAAALPHFVDALIQSAAAADAAHAAGTGTAATFTPASPQ